MPRRRKQDPKRPNESGANNSHAAPSEGKERRFRVSLSNDGTSALLDFDPTEVSETPDAAEVLEAAVELGLDAESIYPVEKLAQALRNTIASGIALKNYPISRDIDGAFSIDVSEDKTLATLTVRKGRGHGKPLDLKALGAAIRASGIQDLDFEKIRNDILGFYRGQELELKEYPLAEGSAPEPGKTRELRFEVRFMSAEEREHHLQAIRRSNDDAPVLESAELIPPEDVEEMAYVRSDTIVATLSENSEGTPGVDVFGASIPPPPGRTPRVILHEYIHLDDDHYVAEIDGVLDRWIDPDDALSLRIRPHLDAMVKVNVAPDAMIASVALHDGLGTGVRLSREMVRQRLIDAGVIKGIDLEAVDEAIRRSRDEGLHDEIVVARGQPPVHAGSGKMRFLIELASGKGVTIKEDGTADFKNQDRITTVEAGQAIAEIVSPDVTKRDGWNVLSKTLPAESGPLLQIELGDGIRSEETEEGNLRLVASRTGELFYDGSALSIQDVYTIKGDVGIGTGNVKFPGSVNVTGNVKSGFYVVSKGTVKIAQGVEAALVSADESVHIQQGIRGGGKAVVRARNEVSCSFIERATIMAIEDIRIKNSCLQSKVKCNGTLVFETDKGRLVGGITQARRGIKAKQIGTSTGVKTFISFGQDYLIGDKIELEEGELAKLKEQAVKIDSVIRESETGGEAKRLAEARKKKVTILKLIEKRTERLFWLHEKFEQHYPSQVIVKGSIYPGVVLESHGRTYDILHEQKNVIFQFDLETGRIETVKPEKRTR